MNHDRARELITALANGIDPLTGEAFPADSQYQHPDVVRALFHALRQLERQPAAEQSVDKAEKKRTRTGGPANAGKAWSTEEDAQLLQAFDSGTTIPALVQIHARSHVAIEARLAKHGRMAMPNGMRTPWPPKSTRDEKNATHSNGVHPSFRAEDSARSLYAVNA